MKYQPWAFEPTQTLYNLFLEKFGKVWQSEYMYQFDPSSQEEENGHINQLSNEYILFYREDQNYKYDDDDLPALTLSAFCEFVDEIQDKFIIPDSQKILMNIWLKSEIQEKIAKQLKHFAVDHWDEPEKIINEVKKYI